MIKITHMIIRKKYQITILLTLLSIVLFTSSCSNNRQKNTKPIDLIPTDASIIISTNNLRNLWDSYYKSDIWETKKTCKDIKSIFDHLLFIDDLSNKNKDINNTITSNEIYLSIHTNNNKTSSLLVFPSEYTLNNIESFIKKEYSKEATITNSIFSNTKIKKIIFAKRNDILYVSEINNILLFSYNEDLVKQSIQQNQKKTSLLKLKSFTEIKSTTGEFVDTKIFLNTNKITDLLSAGTKTNQKELLQSIKNLANFSALDLTTIPNQILLSGYTQTDSTSFLSVIKTEQSMRIKPGKFINDNIAFFLLYNIADYSQYIDKKISTIQNIEKKKQLTTLINKYNLKKGFLSKIHQQVFLAVEKGSEKNISNHSFCIIESDKGLLNTIDAIAKKSGSRYSKRLNNITIKKINESSFFETIFGEAFSNITKNYYCSIEDKIVFGNSPQAVVRYINKLNKGETINKDNTYKETLSNISDEANIFFYANIHNTLPLARFLNSSIQSAYKNNKSFFNSLNGFSIQFSNIANQIYTSIYLNTGKTINNTRANDNTDNWELQLDARMVGKPYIVSDHTTREKRIIIFDALNNMYFINKDGKILWKHKISGRPISKIFEVDAFKNKKTQYLFNTENKIYLIDILGRDLKNYPVTLPVEATNSISVFDYANKKNYRILFAGSDRKIYNYDIKGKQVKGWNKFKTYATVTAPLQHIVCNNKDYIIVVDKTGRTYFRNRKGASRITISNKFHNAPQTKFYLNNTNSKSPILTTDNTGTLTYMNTNGRWSTTQFGTFSKKHKFYYTKFNDDRFYDFVYIDNNKIKVIDRMKNTIIEKDFSKEAITNPELTTYNGNTAIIFTSLSNNTIHLISADGEHSEFNKYKGDTPFALGKLKTYDPYSIIIGSKEKLHRYLIH